MKIVSYQNTKPISFKKFVNLVTSCDLQVKSSRIHNVYYYFDSSSYQVVIIGNSILEEKDVTLKVSASLETMYFLFCDIIGGLK